jgi:hypothetical protein
MAKTKFVITAEELAKGLDISLVRLYEVVDFFDADSKDEWELKEGEHFIWLVKSARTRTFSEFGAYAIAKYLDTTQPQGFWSRFKEFVSGHKRKLRQAFIRTQVLDNCSSLMVRNGGIYLSKADAVNILMTSHPRFNKAFEDLRTSDMPLVAGSDFADFDEKRYFRLSGFERISHLLGEELTAKDRRAWCAETAIVVPRVFEKLMDAEMAFEGKVQSAKKAVRRKEKNRCQATGRKDSPAQRLTLNVHHIFCRHHYPQLAASHENLVTLDEVVHNNFHAWNGKQPCTADRLIEFLSIHHPEAEDLTLRLHSLSKAYAPLKAKELKGAS